MYHREVVKSGEDHPKKLMNMMGGIHNDHNGFKDCNAYIIINDESISSSFEESSNSKGSSSSKLLLDDASSSYSSSSPRQSSGPLYELSELMEQLPIKRGLSKYYQGKSQSFKSLAKVANSEDLAKKETPHQRRLKLSRSYGGGLKKFRSYTLPKARISKKVSKGSLSNLSACLNRKGSFIGTCKAPLSPMQIRF